MIPQILVNNYEFSFDVEDLPLLIEGEDGSGASLFSIVVAATIINAGKQLVFFTAFPQAAEQLLTLVNPDSVARVNSKSQDDIKTSLIVESGNWELMIETATNYPDAILFIKNLEEYGDKILEINNRKKLILSGNLKASGVSEQIHGWGWKNQISFSEAPEKYHAVLNGQSDVTLSE